MRRHLDLWAAGEDLDPETGVSHLGHLAASCAIILDAMGHGTPTTSARATTASASRWKKPSQ